MASVKNFLSVEKYKYEEKISMALIDLIVSTELKLENLKILPLWAMVVLLLKDSQLP